MGVTPPIPRVLEDLLAKELPTGSDSFMPFDLILFAELTGTPQWVPNSVV